ncbi:MAG: methylenetetrahydrofolate reductase [NAD(P)H] [Bacteroidetes bacterium]|nr:methylenetetrahydrofolate reductase [NAD(P)H] [Bacteroidota bacterium]
MNIREIFQQPGPHFSFEFFPPKTEQASMQLFNSIKELTPLKPSYVSVTYGAGGSTRSYTKDLVVRLQKETQLTVVSHITCVGASRDEIRALIDEYQQAGIENFMALRGDPPQGEIYFTPHPQGFRYAYELVTFLKHHYPSAGIGVAGYPEGHPETPNRLKEIEYLKAKVDAGADYICTQLFFDNRDFYDFCERCELAGIRVPIIAGIMPITSRKVLYRIADQAGGTRFPAKLLKALGRTESDEAFQQVGIHWATEQVLDLLDHNIKGIHFYTLNKSKATVRIYGSLGVRTSDDLRK